MNINQRVKAARRNNMAGKLVHDHTCPECGEPCAVIPLEPIARPAGLEPITRQGMGTKCQTAVKLIWMTFMKCLDGKRIRMEKEELKAIQRQMANAANELDALRAMLYRWPDKQKELRGASDILAKWEIGIIEEYDEMS